MTARHMMEDYDRAMYHMAKARQDSVSLQPKANWSKYNEFEQKMINLKIIREARDAYARSHKPIQITASKNVRPHCTDLICQRCKQKKTDVKEYKCSHYMRKMEWGSGCHSDMVHVRCTRSCGILCDTCNHEDDRELFCSTHKISRGRIY